MLKRVSVYILLSMILFVNMDKVAFADTGDFYEKYEQEFKDRKISKDFEKILEKYDYDTNTFECGKFDVNCMWQGGVYQGAIGLVKVTYKTIEDLAFDPTDITENVDFKKYKNGFSTLSNVILMIFILWHAMSIVAQSYADPEGGGVALNQKLVKLLAIGIVLFNYEEFFTYILKIISIAFKAVLKDPVSMEKVVLMVFYNTLYGYFVGLIVAFILAIFAIAFTYRFALYGFLYVTGVIAIPTAMNNEYDYFSVWLRQMVNNGITLVLQALTFSLGFNALIKGTFVLSVSFFILSLAVPSILGQLGASSGSGKAIGSVARTVTRKYR